MPRKYATRKRRSTPRRKRIVRRRRTMNRMQRAAYSYVKKKYTTVIPLTAGVGEESVAGTISHIGGRNTTNPSDCVTLARADPDGMLLADMEQYQFFKVTGIAYKIFFPEGTTPAATPVQWSLAYSANNVLNPALTFGPFQSMATFQTSSCSARTPVKRYFSTATTLKRLGIEWCDTTEVLAGKFDATPPVSLYGDQLPVNAGSSTLFKVFRPRTATDSVDAIGRI